MLAITIFTLISFIRQTKPSHLPVLMEMLFIDSNSCENFSDEKVLKRRSFAFCQKCQNFSEQWHKFSLNPANIHLCSLSFVFAFKNLLHHEKYEGSYQLRKIVHGSPRKLWWLNFRRNLQLKFILLRLLMVQSVISWQTLMQLGCRI